jgi:hypothetical protein
VGSFSENFSEGRGRNYRSKFSSIATFFLLSRGLTKYYKTLLEQMVRRLLEQIASRLLEQKKIGKMLPLFSIVLYCLQEVGVNNLEKAIILKRMVLDILSLYNDTSMGRDAADALRDIVEWETGVYDIPLEDYCLTDEKFLAMIMAKSDNG